MSEFAFNDSIPGLDFQIGGMQKFENLTELQALQLKVHRMSKQLLTISGIFQDLLNRGVGINLDVLIESGKDKGLVGTGSVAGTDQAGQRRVRTISPFEILYITQYLADQAILDEHEIVGVAPATRARSTTVAGPDSPRHSMQETESTI